ncbi:MAG: hypothetical protein ACLFM7_06700 [Bacteroidales bacterium]
MKERWNKKTRRREDENGRRRAEGIEVSRDMPWHVSLVGMNEGD